MGDHESALAHFKKAAEVNPKNIEAVREVRIGEMRSDGGGGEKKKKKGGGDSLFGKLFGGKKK